MVMGRPTKYDPSFCVKVVDLMMEGASKVEVAYHLGVCKDTLYEWEKVHPDFSDAIKKGVGFSEGWWHLQGRKNLENTKFNTPLYKVNLSYRFGYSEKQETKEVKEFSHSEKIENARKRVEKADS